MNTISLDIVHTVVIYEVEMTETSYKSLLCEVGEEISNSPNIKMDRLKLICGDKIPEERHREINSVFDLFKELENSGKLGIDNLGVLKQLLVVLKKTSCWGKVAAFEEERGMVVGTKN